MNGSRWYGRPSLSVQLFAEVILIRSSVSHVSRPLSGQTILGILVWLVVEFGVWPKRATDEALRACADCVGGLTECLRVLDSDDLVALATSFQSLNGHGDDKDGASRQGPSGESPVKLDALIGALSARVALARRLAVAAEREPELWRAPFPGVDVVGVLDGEGRCCPHLTIPPHTPRTCLRFVGKLRRMPKSPFVLPTGCDAALAHVTTAHRAIAAAHRSVSLAAAANASGDAPRWGATRAGGGDACAFLLEPMLPALRTAALRLAAAAASAATCATYGLTTSEPVWRRIAGPSLSAAASDFYRSYDDRCRGLQPRFAAAEAARQAAAAATTAATAASGDAGAGRGAAEEAATEVVSNLEVQAANALAFSLLRLATSDLPRLEEQIEELCERRRLFAA